ncbi:MAG TPA: PepSY-associated TM helix domain-containing protein, partial [Gemmatimonadales bacterium]|nr:PepSY-associated TM helix domain-containing protein [Gemmatimonadales bacterium]
ICTGFMLLLCITGLPLIFHHEIDDLLHAEVKPVEVPPGTPRADLDRRFSPAGLAAGFDTVYRRAAGTA